MDNSDIVLTVESLRITKSKHEWVHQYYQGGEYVHVPSADDPVYFTIFPFFEVHEDDQEEALKGVYARKRNDMKPYRVFVELEEILLLLNLKFLSCPACV